MARETIHLLPVRDGEVGGGGSRGRPVTSSPTLCSRAALNVTHRWIQPKVRLAASTCCIVIKDKRPRAAVTLGKCLFIGFVIQAGETGYKDPAFSFPALLNLLT